MFVDGIKFSCEPCVKGHRSANCPRSHADRPLVEVKKKGRPKTQCQECTERRDRTGGHIRCDCPKPAERAPLELPNGALGLPEGSLSQGLPAPLVRNVSTTSSTSSASSRATSVSGDTQPAEIVRKKSVKRKETPAASKPHDLAHGGHHHHAHTFAPYHTPVPHCRSTPMTRAPSAASADVPLELDFPVVELPPLPPLPKLETPVSFELPPSQEPVTPESVEEILASLEASGWGAGDGGQIKSDAEWSAQEPVGSWTAPDSVENGGEVVTGGEVGYSPDLDPWTATTQESFDLSAEIDKWRQVLQVESADLPPPTLPLGPEWIAPQVTAESEFSGPFTSVAAFLPPPPAFDFPPRPYIYDEGFFSSSSTSSSKAASSVAGSDYSTPLCQGSQLSLSLAEFDLSLDSASTAPFDMGFARSGEYWDGGKLGNGGFGAAVEGQQADVNEAGRVAA